MTTDTIAAQERQAIRAINAMRLGIASRRQMAGHKPGAAPYTINVVAVVEGQEVTRHDYGSGPVLECTCAAFEASRPCAHVAAALETATRVA